MLAALANPHRFMAVSRWATPIFGVIAVLLIAPGLWLGFAAPPDYQQGTTVRIMFIHVPAAETAMFAYACLGAAFTLLALVTGSLWGRPMWGAWWVWDARLTSVLVLFLLFIGYMALRSALDDETKAARAGAILALVGLINLPIVKFSVDWWNSLHQGESIFRPGGPTIAPVFLLPLALMSFGYLFAFAALWLQRTRGEVWRRRAQSLALQAAGG
jgi:heme exporter protein C